MTRAPDALRKMGGEPAHVTMALTTLSPQFARRAAAIRREP